MPAIVSSALRVKCRSPTGKAPATMTNPMPRIITAMRISTGEKPPRRQYELQKNA